MSYLITEGRKLVTVRKINAINPIDGADFIQVATIDGWTVVVKKDEFNVGDYCVFFEIDSFLPASDSRFEFLAKNGTKTDENGVERIRLRSVKLRKTLSQGLALPLSSFKTELNHAMYTTQLPVPEYDVTGFSPSVDDMQYFLSTLENDRSGIEEFLNVTKYERPEERNSNGGNKSKTAGSFPIFIPKTDEERVQNIFGKFSQTMKGVKFRKSLKLDGSSQTIAYVNNPSYFVDKLDDISYVYNEETQELDVSEVKPYPFVWEDHQVLVCSRNLVLKFEPENSFWKAALKDDIPARLKEYCTFHSRQLAVQGENMGPSVQGNREKLEEHEFYAFRVWDIDNNCFLDDADFIDFCNALNIKMAPLGDIVQFFDVYNTIDEALLAADHKSINHPIAEGDVFKSIEKINGVTIHFKVINNKYLLKCED